VKLLNSTAWVPDSNGELHRPEFVVFDSLGWPANDFLCSMSAAVYEWFFRFIRAFREADNLVV
jgi:hypothetical protein